MPASTMIINITKITHTILGMLPRDFHDDAVVDLRHLTLLVSEV